MKVVKTINKLCMCCMEEHNVKLVEVNENNVFKGKKVEYVAIYEYCDLANEYIATEEMITANDIAMKNAYREMNHLLTNEEIIEIRNKYAISQKDLACLLGWGEKTITRYEGHQVQDVAHDSVLRKIDEDPEWFLVLLEKGKERVSYAAYEKYRLRISTIYETMQDTYLKKSIQAQYVKYQDKPEYCGYSKLNFDKIVDVICYFSNAPKMINLYKVKMMKLLWYADFLSYKRHHHSITGLVYTSKPMGAVPVAHKSIIDLKGIPCEEIEFENGSGYKFTKKDCAEYDSLTNEDIYVLDTIIEIFGQYTKEQIINKMHEESAYKETNAGDVISFEYARDLSVS